MRSPARSYRTLDSLKSGRDDVSWYWRVFAHVGSCLILGGFLILPATFNTDAEFRVSKAALGIFSVALLTAGFSLGALVCFACRNWMFQADHVFQPNLTASAIGLLTVFYSFIISRRYVWNVAALLVTVGSAVSVIIFAILLFLAHRRVAAVRKNGERIGPLIPQPGTASPGLTYHDPSYFDNHLANMYPASRSPATQVPPHPPEELTEEDLMRQRLLMLLVNPPEPHINPDPAASTFNRIEFTPLDEPEQTPQAESIPTESRQYYGYYAPDGLRHGSQSTQGGSTMQQWDGVWRSGALPTSQAREQRRQEIEQGR